MSKGIGVTKSNVSREFGTTSLVSTRVFQKKVNEFLNFVVFDVRFVDVRHTLDNCRSHRLHLEEWANLFKFFIL